MRVGTAAESRSLDLSARPSAHPTAERPDAGLPEERRWLAAALAFTLLFAARTMAPAVGRSDVVQSDARQHVFWTARFRDPELFRNDLIADYFQSVAPLGYSALYWSLSWVIDPLAASKVLPFFLGVAAALFTFLLVRRLHPAPVGAFLASILLSWYVWQHDDLSSATPRAFLLPLLTAQLWSLTAGRLGLGAALATLAALLYPVAGVLCVALLGVRLVQCRRWRPGLVWERPPWLTFIAAAVPVGALLASSQFGSSSFGPTVSATQAQTMPAFGPGGRQPFFVQDAYQYVLASDFSGLDLRVSDAQVPTIPILFEYLCLAALLPLLLLFRRRLPVADQLSGQAAILLQLLAASFGLFLLAHLLLFHLYLPSRYVKWSLPLVLAVAAGLALGILIEAVAARVAPSCHRLVVGGLGLVLAIGLAAYPAGYDGGFLRDERPAVTAYLRAQPKDVLVAGVPIDVDSVPALARRRILAGRKHLLPYHLGYHGELNERLEALADAYYAESPREVADFAARYGVDLFLVNRAAFRSATSGYTWGFPNTVWEPFTSVIDGRLQGSKRFALLELARRCATLDDGEVAVVPTTCLRRSG